MTEPVIDLDDDQEDAEVAIHWERDVDLFKVEATLGAARIVVTNTDMESGSDLTTLVSVLPAVLTSVVDELASRDGEGE